MLAGFDACSFPRFIVNAEFILYMLVGVSQGYCKIIVIWCPEIYHQAYTLFQLAPLFCIIPITDISVLWLPVTPISTVSLGSFPANGEILIWHSDHKFSQMRWFVTCFPNSLLPVCQTTFWRESQASIRDKNRNIISSYLHLFISSSLHHRDFAKHSKIESDHKSWLHSTDLRKVKVCRQIMNRLWHHGRAFPDKRK
jgi:hypothetical protein